jgi:hypothetical protein
MSGDGSVTTVTAVFSSTRSTVCPDGVLAQPAIARNAAAQSARVARIGFIVVSPSSSVVA